MAKSSALIVGVSDYPTAITPLPMVANDVSEMAKLLASDQGQFEANRVTVLADALASRDTILQVLRGLLRNAGTDDTLFLYFAGHGGVDPTDGSYYFIPHDADVNDIAGTSVPLAAIRDEFDRTVSEKVFLWLDCCHAGGILERSLRSADEDRSVVERELTVMQGRGKKIVVACGPNQSAKESLAIGHGLFTNALLKGLRGEAAGLAGEVTANSLFDYIDQTMGSEAQRPMEFGQSIGRIVLMQHNSRQPTRPKPEQASGSNAAPEPIEVTSSGNWILVDDRVYRAEKVRELSREWLVELKNTSPEQNAALRNLRPDSFGRREPIPFAAQDVAAMVRPVEIEGESTGEGVSWKLRLSVDDDTRGHSMADMMSFNGETSDDFAQARAGRILLDDPPAPSENRRRTTTALLNEAMRENMLEDGGRLQIKGPVYELMPNADFLSRDDLEQLRLLAIHLLCGSNTVESVYELTFVGQNTDTVSVTFRGVRARFYDNEESPTIEIKGTYSRSS